MKKAVFTPEFNSLEFEGIRNEWLSLMRDKLDNQLCQALLDKRSDF